MPCSKYKGAQRKACYASNGWSKAKKKKYNPYGPKTGRKKR